MKKKSARSLSQLSRSHPFWQAGSLVTALAAIVLTIGCDAVQSLNPTDNNAGGLNGAPPGSPSSFGDSDSESDDGSGQDRSSASIARAIEEADIVKVVGDTLFALNRFKGLLIVDVQNPDEPALLGELDLKGRGVEMYVGDTQAYVLLSADYYYYYDGGYGFGDDGIAVAEGGNRALSIAPDGPPPQRPDFDGSQLAIIDISDPTDPTVESKVNLVGFANESRRVGDIIYVVGSNYAPYFAVGAEEANNDSPGEGFVASVNVADPANITPVERKSLSGNALTMHTSDSAIYAASQSYDFDTGDSLTDIQVIDISDPAGAVVLRDKFTVPGYIQNRFYMDEFGDTFRIATQSTGFGFTQVRLFTYDVSDLDAVAELGSTKIIENESLQAVRFDGERAYAVTFLVVDPLFVIDLKDPANPVVAGELEVPGYSTHIEPRGNRLIAVGIDDTDGNRPAIAYYDVEDPANPAQLGRVILGPPGSYTTSDATYDEKAFKVVDELGLIIVPFQHVDWNEGSGRGEVPPSVGIEEDKPMDDTGVNEPDGDNNDGSFDDNSYGPDCTNGVQLVDFSDTKLTQRGSFENTGNVTRVGVIGERLFALSDLALKTVDISDRDNPIAAGELSFFEGDDQSIYGECGYIYYPVDFVDFNNGGFPLTSDQIERLIALAENCANGAPLPGIALMLTLFFTRGSFTRRRRTKR